MWIERQLYRDDHFERLTPQEGWAFTSTVSRGHSDFRVADVVNRVGIRLCRTSYWERAIIVGAEPTGYPLIQLPKNSTSREE
jgi:hypothetical protein